MSELTFHSLLSMAPKHFDIGTRSSRLVKSTIHTDFPKYILVSLLVLVFITLHIILRFLQY